jgi:hypothetical protein
MNHPHSAYLEAFTGCFQWPQKTNTQCSRQSCLNIRTERKLVLYRIR